MLVLEVVWALVLVGVAAITATKGKWATLALGVVLFPAWIVGAARLGKVNSVWARRFYDGEKLARARAREADSRAPTRTALVAAGVVGAVLLIGFFTLMKAYRIPSSAMEPTLRCPRPAPGCSGHRADRVAAIRFLPGIHPRRGDLVTFMAPETASVICGTSGVFVKRVIGLPGETILTATSLVLVNGKPLQEPYLAAKGQDTRRTGPTEVPRDTYFLMGDNRALSCDSREYGPVARDRLIAKILVRYWPLNRIGTP